MYTAGDVYAAQRELGTERAAEWPAYIHWRASTRQGDLEGVDYDAWLDTVDAAELPGLIDAVNEVLAADDPPEPSSRSLVAAG